MAQILADQQGLGPNPIDSTGICLLSLDGGGVRGLSTLHILKSIMDWLNEEREKVGLLSVKPCEVFDLIGGTSTGGLIAIMLGRLEMDVDACIEAYIELAEDVFSQKSSKSPVKINGELKPRFDSTKLESAIKKVLTQNDVSVNALFNDRTERGCRTFVCAIDSDTTSIVRFRSYGLTGWPDYGATICQAALATSAATSFFEPVTIDDQIFADGAFGANNPVDEVEGEASNIWGSEDRDLKELVKCFISVGTGKPGIKAFETSIIKFLSKTVVRIATETETAERNAMERWAKHYDKNRYFRFNVHEGLEGIGLDEYQKKGLLKSATRAYLTHTTQRHRVRDCIHNLRLKQSRASASLASAVNEYRIRVQMLLRTSHKACWVVPFARNPNFVDQRSQHTKLDQLEENLFSQHHPTTLAIYGLGGIGKTQVALDLAYRARQKYPACSVFWISADNAESVQQAFANISLQLDVPRAKYNQTNVAKLLQHHLNQEGTRQWLLVVNNVDDVEI
ncbi:acyl transferase/acyl hydrolase/lysophospholipase [Clohesyomyces aquaticus]|uniref:Acyl transferase/acyl hydrolase/lysophospholipase n=1 Tax=Clohesyomyces aquaticus TaxID=1231657 RepID=A0A1Y1ZIP7_9PLEO|nr:acyl transferase/acyl hydrolase/lysophospholipase [Clohesyomyces aquaticus]